MTVREIAERAGWFPGAGSTRPRAGRTASTLATNGYLSSMLSATERVALREINIRLTDLAIQQWEADGGAANQIEFGTQIGTSLADFVSRGVLPDELRRLSRDLDVVFPWSLLYGNARTPFNLRLVRLPLVIAFPRTVKEVVGWVEFVRCHGFSVSIRSGNNSYEGLSSSNEVVIDLTFLTLAESDGAQFEIDAAKKQVKVAPGVRLGVLYTELAKHDLALAGGQCAPVCVGGLVGTGGIGFLTRTYGWACDQLIEVEYVLANGDVVKANERQHAELYRATKGAGAAGLGIMTKLTLQLVPAARHVLFYSIWFDGLAPGPAVLEAWQNLAATAPKAFSSLLAASAATPRDDEALLDPAGGGRPNPPPPREGLLSVNGEFRVEHDDVAKAREELIGILKGDWLGRLPAPLDDPLIVDLDECPTIEDRVRRRRADGQGRPLLFICDLSTVDAATAAALLVPMPILNQWKLKSRFTFGLLPAADFQRVFDYLQSHAPSDDPTKGQGFINPWLLGGRSNEIDAESAVVPVREDAVMWFAWGALWNDPSIEADALAFVDGLSAELDEALHHSSTAFYNSPELELGSQLGPHPKLDYVSNYWSSPTHDFVPFLIQVKKRYDPTDLFKFAQSIPLVMPESRPGGTA